MSQSVKVNVKTGEVTRVATDNAKAPSPQQTVAKMRRRMNITRAELVEAMGIAGILKTKGFRISFAQGNIPPPLRAMIDELPEAIQEKAEVLLLTASEFPRVSIFWDAAIEAGQISNIQLDNIYRQIEENRKKELPE